jgi:uncharacterized protein (TIGR03435 family)
MPSALRPFNPKPSSFDRRELLAAGGVDHGMTNVSLSLVLAAFLGCAANAIAQQPAPAPPVYDIVVIKPNHSLSHRNTMGLDQAGTLRADNVSLTQLMVNAYGMRNGLMFGLPPWADSSRFDITAKISDPDVKALSHLSNAQRQAMLVSLLADRFHLKTHTEIKTLSLYVLVLAKGGPKLTPTVVPPPDVNDPDLSKQGGIAVNDTSITATATTLPDFALNLGLQLDRSVIDKTGLSGRYDIRLRWSLDGVSAGATDAPPDMFTAIQEQLGLKLLTAKGPVQTLMVDHVEQPTGN